MWFELRSAMRLAALVAACLALVACRPPGYGKGDDDGVDAAATGDGPRSDAAIDSPAAATCLKAFRLDGHSTATSVWLTGTFTMWAATPGAGAIVLTQGVDGAWTGDHTFTAGTYQYKFIVDGNTWILDPTNLDTVDDGMGNQNSRYICTP